MRNDSGQKGIDVYIVDCVAFVHIIDLYLLAHDGTVHIV
jgi:hypothetical protein